MGFDEKNNQV
jgi:GTPase